MKTFDLWLVVASLVVTVPIAYGAEREPRKPEPSKSSRTKLVELQRSVKAFSLLQSANKSSQLFISSGPPTSCSPANTADKPCMIDALVTELFDGKQKLVACAVMTKNIVINSAKKNDKIWIQWNKIDPGTIGATYKFKEPLALLITIDGDDSTIKKQNSLTDTSATLIVNLQKDKPTEVHYYPLIFQTLSDKTEFMCGAGDPTIVNN